MKPISFKGETVFPPAYLFLLGLAASVLLAACRPVTHPVQSTHQETITLAPGHTAGQTFTTTYAGLNGIRLLLEPPTAGAELSFEIRCTDRSGVQVVTNGTRSLPAGGALRYYLLSFHPSVLPAISNCSLQLSHQSPHPLAIALGPPQAYLHGSSNVDGLPYAGQLVFKLDYDSAALFRGLLKESASWLVMLLAGAFLLLTPGWGLLTVLKPAQQDNGDDIWQRLALSAGLSLAIYPLLMLYTSLLGLRLGATYAWLPGGLGIALALWATLKQRRSTHSSSSSWTSDIVGKLKHLGWGDLSLAIILTAITLSRLWPLRTLPAPMWGDSYQHSVITQLLLDNQGLFTSWEPYARLATFTYHFGFHALAAAFQWITHVATAQAVLWSGQILNILAVFAVYPLVRRISANRWAGIIAVALAGLLSAMPNRFMNWGRYTQLAGLALLPVAIVFLWDYLTSQERRPRIVVLVWLAFSGLALTHYRVLVFAALFAPAYLLLDRSQGTRLVDELWHLLFAGGGAFLLFLPWFLRVFGGKILALLAFQLRTPASQLQTVAAQTNTIGPLSTYLPAFFWLLFALGIAWAILRRDRPALTVLLWWALIWLAANPALLGLPGTGALSNFAVLISAYLPAAVLSGAAGAWLLEFLAAFKPTRRFVVGYTQLTSDIFFSWPMRAAFILALAALTLWGVRSRLADIDPRGHALVTWPDISAAAWIDDNLPQDALLVVNAFTAFGGTSVVGSDAGWWLPLLAQRATTLPVLNYAFEQGATPDFGQQVNQLVQDIQTRGPDDPAVLAELQRRGVGYAYIGQRQGAVNAPQPPLLVPATLLKSPAYKPIYHQDRVWIFQILSQESP